MNPLPTTRRLSVRSVNGDGPSCGCGAPSSLHTEGPNSDIFLCARCAIAAAEAYIRANRQDDQGPPASGDYWYGLSAREHEQGWHRNRPERWCHECTEANAA